MSDKPKPVEDLKEGLGLLFRAAKGAVGNLPTDKIEGAAKDAVKEVGRAFESLGNELEKVVEKVSGSTPPAQQPPSPPADTTHAEADAHKNYDDGYAPESPPKGPRVG